MGKIAIGIVLTMMVLGLLPFALIARTRASQSPGLPIHLVMDMDKQSKFKAQRETPMFADKRSMRPEIPGTLAQEDLGLNSEMFNDSQHPARLANFDGKESLEFNDIGTYSAVMFGRIRTPAMTDEAVRGRSAPPGGR